MKCKEEGFGILEVVIAAALLSMLTLAISTVVVDLRKSTLFIEDQFEKVEIARTIETILASSAACQQTLNGILVKPNPAVSTDIATIKDNSGNIILSSNADFDKLLVGQISIRNDTVPAPSSTGFIDLVVPLSRTRTGGGPKIFAPVSSKVGVTVNALRQITACSSSTGNSFGGIYTLESSTACSKPNAMTGACTCPPGYNSEKFADGVSGLEQYFYYCVKP